MNTRTWAQSERQGISDLFVELGPDAPTLCGDWTTRDLAAHLIVRESRPDAALGIVAKPLAGWGARVQDRASERPWDELVSAVRQGPPKISLFSLPKADEMLNTGEYFIHLEDVRRAAPDWTPRELPAKFRNTLWNIAAKRGSMLFRKAPTGVVLERTDGSEGLDQKVVRKGDKSVTISGPAAEILLYSFGRRDHALVTISGDPDAIRALNNTDLSV